MPKAQKMRTDGEWRELAEMYKRQLGGSEAALRRARQRIKELEDCTATPDDLIPGARFIEPELIGTLSVSEDGMYPREVHVSGPVGVVVYTISGLR